MTNCKFFIIFYFLIMELKIGESKLEGVLDVEEFHKNSLPYQVLIRYKEQYICEGIILTENNIVTTSSCVFPYAILPFQNLRIITANVNLSTSKQVINITLHPEYKYGTNENNFAVINLDIPFNFTNYEKPANLSDSLPIIGSSCKISAWKVTKQNGLESNAFCFLNASIVNQNACNGSLLNGICVKVNHTFENGCQMRLGNALVCDNKLCGLSFLTNTYQNTNSVVYTPIAKNINFLHSAVESNIKAAIRPRIVGGKDVESMTQTPYQVSIRHSKCRCHLCSGAIVGKIHVLTTILCLRPEDLPQKITWFSVMAGSTNSDDNSIVKSVESVIVHEDFNKKTRVNDIALIRISDSFEFTDTVAPIKFPTEIMPTGKSCHVSGWGDISYDGPRNKKLQFINIKIIDRKKCDYHYLGLIHTGMICAGKMDGSKAVCNGDTGGPLVCDDRVTGLTSWGAKCTERHRPGIFTDVYKYKDWIRKYLIEAEDAEATEETSSSHKICLKLYLLFIQYGLFTIFYWQ